MVDRVSTADAPNVAAAHERPSAQELKAEGDRLYTNHVAPLEQEHRGEYAAVAPDGRLMRGKTSYEVSLPASEAFGRGNFVFKIGDRVLGRLGPRYRLEDR